MENQKPFSKYNRAKRKMERLKSFYTHLSIFTIVNLGLITLKVWGSLYSWDSFVSKLLTFDTLSSVIVWGFILGIHAFVVFILPQLLGYDWEERKIERLMQEELNRKK